MKTSPRLLALASLALAAPCASQAAVTLYDGTFASPVTTASGNASNTYGPSTKYAFHAYQNQGGSPAVVYNEIDPGGGNKYLQFTNNGGVDGVLRYVANKARVENWVNNAPSPALSEPFLADIAANPVLSFDITYVSTTGTDPLVDMWASVRIDVQSDAPAPNANPILFSQVLTLGETTRITFDFSNTVAGTAGGVNYGGSDGWNNWLTAMGGGLSTNNPQIRIAVQTATGIAGTFIIDNIQLATPVPEPASFATLGGFAVLGLAALRRRRR